MQQEGYRSMNNMRVWLINRFYWPDEQATAQLASDLCEGLVEKGFSVGVISSGSQGVPEIERRNGVAIFRVSRRFNKQGALVFKALDYVRFILKLRKFLAGNLQAGDVVIALSDPPLLGVWAGGPISAKRATMVQWLQDIYPEVVCAVTTHTSLSRLLSLLNGPRNRSLRRSAACITLGADMGTTLLKAGVPKTHLRIIANWAPKGLQPAEKNDRDKRREELGLSGKFVVCYSGNFGRVHEIACLSRLAELLRLNATIRFLFIGVGARRNALEDQIRGLGIDNVLFAPPCSREELSLSLSVADLHLITLRRGCENSVFPSKLYGIAGVGSPVLFLGETNCEIARQIKLSGMGEAFLPEQTGEAADFILRLASTPDLLACMKSKSLDFASQTRGSCHALDAWAQLIRNLASVRPQDTLSTKSGPP
jgi:hypothetical protein